MRHRVTSLTTLFALAAGTMLSLPVWAATNTTWIDDPDNRGTEASPINLYDKNKWASGALPSATYNINFIADGLTYVTNTASASTQIATSLRFGGGDFVVFGPMNSASFGYDFSETAPVSVDKRGDWTCSGRFFTATANNSHFAFTNRTGKLDICSGAAARIGNGNNTVASFVLEGGSVTGSSSGYNLTMGYGTGATAYFEQNGGTASIAGRLQLGYNGTGELTINNGTFTVGDQVILGVNGAASSGRLVFNGGLLETPYISCGNNGQGGTILFNGGTLKAAPPTQDRLIQGSSKIKVRVGERGGTIDTAGLDVNYSKTTLTADGVTDDGGLAIVGGGLLTVIGNPSDLRFEYNGQTKIELGTRVSIPTTKLGGGVTFTIPSGLARAIYTPLTVTGDFTLEDVLAEAVLPSDPDAQFLLSSDKKKIFCYYKLDGIQDPYWIGGPTGNLGDGANWSSGTVPQSGNCYIGIGDQAATLTSSASFRPDSITFTEGSKPVTINGSDDIAGIAVVTNLSAVNHTINVPVRFAGKIRVKQGAMAWASRTSPQVVFAGGAYGTSIDENYSRFVSGHYILSDESVPLVANQTLDRERYGILAGSSLTVPCATNLTHLLNGAGGDTAEDGGAFTTGVYRVLGTNVCRYNQGRTAEFVVTNELVVPLSEHKYLAYRKADGWFKFKKVTIGSSSGNYIFYFGNHGDFYYDKYIRVGSGGLGFEPEISSTAKYQIGKMTGDNVTIAPWFGDFAIGTKGLSNMPDVKFSGKSTIFDTTDESGVGRTITIDALCEGTYDVKIKGSGSVVVNNRANTCSSAVDVSGGATLALNAGCPLGKGSVTVTGATLKANSSGVVSFASNVVCKANSTLAFHFTEKRTAPCLAFNSAMSGNAMPAALNVRITADDGKCPSGGRYTLTTGYDFTSTTLTLVDQPEWIKYFGKDESGNIVIEAKSKGMMLVIR